MTCIEGRVEAELALGRHAELALELGSLVAEHPFRERLRGQHMVALYRLGRRADAIDSYRSARRVLVDELGLEPGPALPELERAILVDDRSLAAGGSPARSVPSPEQLPPDVRDFTGREPVLARLRALLETTVRGEETGGVPVVAAMSGKPGVGKSASALHAAHRMRERFGDGQLYVSLRGTEPDALDPGDVLDEWLRALGVAAEMIPPDTAARPGLSRAVVGPARAGCAR